MILCDTNIIIEVLKGKQKTIELVEKIGINQLTISSITEMELYFGAFNKTEMRLIQKYIRLLPIVHINNEISIKAVELIEKFATSHKLTIPDALIAATVINENYTLLTMNIKDFKFIPGLKLYEIGK
jgi:predicted nucleic acid-binding protein